MSLRHSLAVTLSNYKLVIKIFIFSAILSLIAMAIFVSIYTPILDAVGAESDFSWGLELASERLLRGDVDIIDDLLHKADAIMSGAGSNFAGALAGSLIMALIIKFLFAFMSVGAGFVIYNKMSARLETKFVNAMVSNLAKALMYALVNAVVTVPVDIGILVAVYYLAKVMSGMGIVGLIITIFIGILLYSARLAVIGQFIPTMIINGEGFVKSFKESCRASVKAFKETYPAMFVLALCVFVAICTTTVPTVGIAPIAILPITIVLYCSFNMIIAFRTREQKYYIDERVIEN